MNTRITVLLIAFLTALALASEAPLSNAPATIVRTEAAGVAKYSTNVSEVIRLAESGMDEPIVLAFIEASRTPFNLSADDLIYLNDIGIGSPLITAMLHQDAVLREQPLDTGLAAVTAPAPPPASNASPAPGPIYVTNAPAAVAYFHESLAPFGTWIEAEDLGWCWQPSVVAIDHSWRPYWQGGRWTYTDFGWYWTSDYSWGWAPFHYGRWQLHPRCGWVWLPDLVWAPAWVCWRYSDAYCGWAPLPPGAHFVDGAFRFNGVGVGINFDFHLGVDRFTFVDLRHFSDHQPRFYGVPPTRVAEVYRTTTVVNYFVGRNNTVISHGVPVTRVSAATGRSIRPVEVRTTIASAGTRVKPERLDATGKLPVVYRPELKAPANTPPMVAQRVDQQHPIVHQPARPFMGAPARNDGTVVGKPVTSTPRAPVSPPAPPVRPRVIP